METKKPKMGPATRLEIGTVVLTAAEVTDTKPVQRRLDRFIAVHRDYVGAQRKVEAVEARLQEVQAQLAICDAEQDAALEALVRALVFEGQARSNPFAAFGSAAPSFVKKLLPAEKAEAIHQLIAAVRRSKSVSQPTRAAAQAAEQAARAVEALLPALDPLEATRGKLRYKRDAIGQNWDTALAVLRRDARAAVDEGAPGLYNAFFGRLGRPARKHGKAAPTPTPAPAAATANAA